MSRGLRGARVAITRAPEQAVALTALVADRGGVPVLIPCLRVAAPESTELLDRALARLPDAYDGVLFPSTNSVRWTLARTSPAAFAGVCVVATGSATAEALKERGVEVRVVPRAFHSEGVLAALDQEGSLAGTRWLLPRADVAREVLPAGLEERGARVDRVVAYRNLAPEPGPVVEALQRGVEVITFASGSAVVRLAEALGERLEELLKDVVVASIGPVTSAACRDAGLPVHVEAPQARIASLVDALVSCWETKT